jgi:MFS family permease
VTATLRTPAGSRRRAAVLRHDNFRLLFFATLGSGIGNWLALIALPADVYNRTNHSGWWISAVLIANIVPTIAIGLLFGPLVDRLSRKGLMIASDLGRLGVFAMLPFVTRPEAIVALAVVAGIGNGFFRPAVLAGVPNLVADDELSDANALLQLADWTTTAGGPLLAGAIVAASGPHLAYVVNAATFAVSAAFVAWIPARLLQSERPIGRGYWRDIGDGFRAVLGSRPLVTVLVAWSIAQVLFGFVNVAEIFLARRAFEAGNFGFGLLWSATGVGLVIGGLAVRPLSERFNVRTLYPRALLLLAIAAFVAASAPNVWVGAAAMVVFGFGNGIAIVQNITLVQRSSEDAVRGRALTAIMSANYTVMLVAFVVAGPLIDTFGPRPVYAMGAGAMVVAALVAMRLLDDGSST